MPYAQVLTTASKATTTGGTFADALTANSNDSLSVANFDTGGARVLEMWGTDDTSAAEFSWVWTRPEATHDQNRGMRVSVPGVQGAGAAKTQAFNMLPGGATIKLFKSDTVTVNVTSTASDNVMASWVTEYDDLPGASGVFTGPDQLAALRKSTVGIRVSAVGSATRGAYGASRAFNADDDRLHANTWYAVLGCSVQVIVNTVSLIGPDWGGQRIGLPAGYLQAASTTWFLDQSIKWGKNLIPCFNSNNKGNVLVATADTASSPSAQIDFLLYELTQQPGF
jgi:hypothetical protein